MLEEEERSILQAYVNGINDYVAGVSILNKETDYILPPEFWFFGMTYEVQKPFTIADVLAYGRLISFQLTWNWNHDMQREALR